ncbi:hypothetical protein RclHR1_12680002 [Rhizophagus clarus]|uniref:Uncharacterized protein n=1 Tax=Rhizophagus clarus TaxID=94130 RepID=A0A2Z6R0R5_9GLOM|nr:hypothetical protein RclHR1_12680002 [Rhizophagus clarus]GES83374.1 hypothetical protein GLOIN_2v1869616 [Rhizophagus clarus]
MSSKLELLKQRITELEAENAKLRKENTVILKLRNKLSVFEAEITELKHRNAETLRLNEEYNERRDAKNAKLKTRIEELKSENVEFRNRLTKVEQKQTLQSALMANDNSSNNRSPSFNSVAVSEAITVPTNSVKRLNGKLLEEKDMDSFLLETHKKIVSSKIKQRNKEKKLLRESAKNQVLAVTSVDSKLICDKKPITIGNDQDLKLSLSIGNNISPPSLIEDSLSCNIKMTTCTNNKNAPSDEISGPIATQPLDRNQVTEQTLKHELSRPISSVVSVKLHDESILNNAIEGSTQRLAYWIDEAIRMGLKEILCLYHYSLKFEEKVKNITADGKTKDKTARSMIYKDMLQYLPNVTLGNLRIRTHRAKNILMLFGEKGVGINRMKLVTCSASDISRLNNTQIPNIIDYVNDRVHVISKTVTNGNDQSHMTSAETISSVTPQASKTSLTYDHAYFRNKALDQYPNLHREFSSENFDYYGITDETSCPLCKLDHDDEEGIEGRYEARSYFIKCEQREIEIVA